MLSATRFSWVFMGTLLVAALSVTLGLLVGKGQLSHASLGAVFLELRAYRVGAAFFAGSALAVGGVLVQGLFRNPLASPSILGTTAGASLGGQGAMIAYQSVFAGVLPAAFVPEMFVPVGCILGALLALGILMAVTRGRGDLVVVLLTGFLLSSLFLSLGAFLTTIAQESWELGRAVLAFTLGGVGGAGPRHVIMSAVIAAGGVIAAWGWARPLDLLQSGQAEAESLGVDVTRVRRWCVVWTAILSGSAVAVGGNISFVGLVVPHAVRSLIGPAHRRLVPICALGGGAFVVAADVLTRVLSRSGEMPLGVVTGLVGAPLFLWLLVRARTEWLGG